MFDCEHSERVSGERSEAVDRVKIIPLFIGLIELILMPVYLKLILMPVYLKLILMPA